MISLVGYTGFVGSNILAGGHIDSVYNSSNIKDAYGTCPDLLIYAGMRAEKFLANNDPDRDLELARGAYDNIISIAPKKLVLISTIDVYGDPVGADETTKIDPSSASAYGRNRYCLEQWVRRSIDDALIIRLPGLFGMNIKKNFIYDLIHMIPSMLKADKFDELASEDDMIRNSYSLQSNGFYKLLTEYKDDPDLRSRFILLGFTSLNFTDSRSTFQFYDLSRLYQDIMTALDAGIKIFNPATEPVSSGELYRAVEGCGFDNKLAAGPVFYDYRTVYDSLFGGSRGYLTDKEDVICKVTEFVRSERGKISADTYGQ